MSQKKFRGIAMRSLNFECPPKIHFRSSEMDFWRVLKKQKQTEFNMRIAKFILFTCLWTGIFFGFLEGQAQVRGEKMGLQGKVWDPVYGVKIPGVRITLTQQGVGKAFEVRTDSVGGYQISVPKGVYAVTAEHPDYEPYASAPGFFFASRKGFQSSDIALKKKREIRATTVIVVRHAERGTAPLGDPELSEAGMSRAQELLHIVEKSGVAAVYSTAFNRTRQTIAPVARQFGLTPVLYAEPDELKAHILQHYEGKTVLVTGHSNTVGPIVQTLAPGTVVEPIADGEYDNLYIVVLLPVHTQVLRLKYGDKTP